ncbi:MAG: adenosylcobinamide-GDP ribazoletransferase [Egibacteraceae bacterium]
MLDALRFLTTLPFKPAAGPPAPSSVRWFPLAGLVVGATWALFFVTTNLYLGPFAAAAVVLIADGLLTGALHLDAFADVIDGVASRRPADEAIRIMREPQVGAVGSAGLVLVCLLRASLLVLAASAPVTLIAVPIAGRAAMALLLARVDARADGSLATAFRYAELRPTLEAIGLAVALVLTPALAMHNPAPFAGLASLGVALMAALGYGRWWRARFGALTGDGVGACGFVAETLALVVLALQLDRV